MQTLTHLAVLDHAPNLQVVVQKLPSYLQNKWREQATNRRLLENRSSCFGDIVQFVIKAAECVNDPVFGKEAMHRELNSSKPSKGKPTESAFAMQVNHENQSRTRGFGSPSCFYCGKNHDLDNCADFRQKSLEEKRKFIIEQRRCFSCYGLNHTSKGCMNKRKCHKCGKGHPTAMHIDGFKLPWRSDYSDRSSNSQNRTEESSQKPPDTATSNIISHGSSMVLQAILPVRIKQRGTNREVLTYALYDPGSTGCFLSEELKDDLQASGVQTNLRLKTMHGESIVKSYLVRDLVVSDINGQNGILLPKTYSRQEIPVSHDQIPHPELLRHWPYLHNVAKSIPEVMPEIDIGLLIGSNCPLAMEPLKIISTDGKGPFALQYRHGWTVSSPVEDNSVTSTHRVNSNRIVTEDIEQATEILSPNRILNILESDFIDSRVARYPGEKGLSPEDTIFMKKAESNVVFKDGHFEIPLPFRNQNLIVPNNKILAIKRALYQKKKMQKDPKYHSDYVNFIDKILQNDYAERIPDSLLTAKSGYVVPAASWSVQSKKTG
ncbi:uncharacterized protein [Macrobrachium rosenbergii]|uniref:uncharacterized protein n=1 Tax=Macrobrachium rosenbergii TaxID=79674 RepID=UPI0034D62A85